MKGTSGKLMVLALYLSTVMAIWTLPVFSQGLIGLVAKGVALYCGIIVVAHLVDAICRVVNWVISFERRAYLEHQETADLSLDVETEATGS